MGKVAKKLNDDMDIYVKSGDGGGCGGVENNVGGNEEKKEL